MNHFDPNMPPNDDQRQFNSNQFLGGLFQELLPGNQYGNYPGNQWPGQGGFPGGPPGFPNQPFPGPPGGGFPGQPGGGIGGPPTSPPPSGTPQEPLMQTKAVDPGAIRGCLYRFTYIWLRRNSFWFYPVYVGRESVAGYRWHRNRWTYFGIDLDRIRAFQCF